MGEAKGQVKLPLVTSAYYAATPYRVYGGSYVSFGGSTPTMLAEFKVQLSIHTVYSFACGSYMSEGFKVQRVSHT